jgi:hypothetical protein
MKKIFGVLFAIIFLVALGRSALAQSDTGWQIIDFKSRIVVSQDATMDITETVAVDFGSLSKHGIYRTIPLRYRDNYGQSYKLKFNLISVTDATYHTVPYTLSGLSEKTLKIGDADRTVSGRQSYIIHYQVKRGVRFLDSDEIYWNATGNTWPVPIEKTSAEVIYPDGTSNVKAICFKGAMGSRESCVASASGHTAAFTTTNLAAYEGLTIVAGAPKGTLTPPSAMSLILDTLWDNLPYLLIPITFAAFLFIWWRLGRDPKTHHTIVPEFAPPGNLSPSLMGLVKDEKVDMLDISVAIIHLASRGFLTIEETTKKKLIGKNTDYKLIRKDTKQSASRFETQLLDAIFGAGKEKLLSDLKNHFYKHIPKLKNELYDETVAKGYFAQNPNSVRGTYVALGILIPGAVGALLALASSAWVAFIVSSIIILPFAIWFGLKMPRKTVAGAEMWRQIQGFRLFINTAERYRERFNEDHNIFSKYLPYAMVFGLTKKWAKAFDGLKIEPPSWYVGHTPFNALIFANTMTSASTSMNSALVSSPSSSGSSGFGGGGFSGGGFGGGGGGSW